MADSSVPFAFPLAATGIGVVFGLAAWFTRDWLDIGTAVAFLVLPWIAFGLSRAR